MNYTVSPSETIFDISNKFGVPVDELMAYNNLSPNSLLSPGMIIVIPPRRPSLPTQPFPPQFPPQNRIYVVRRGDTIWSISRMFGVSVQNIMFTNNLTFPVVFPGQRLIIPQRIMPR